jgi:transposase
MQWAAILPLLPGSGAGARRVDDRRVISGIIHVLKSGCRWQDCPSVYGPPTTIYNRFHSWSGRHIWHRLHKALVEMDGSSFQAIDGTGATAHRSTSGKGGRMRTSLAAPERQKPTSKPIIIEGL